MPYPISAGITEPAPRSPGHDEPDFDAEDPGLPVCPGPIPTYTYEAADLTLVVKAAGFGAVQEPRV